MLNPEDHAVLSPSAHWITDSLISTPKALKSKRALDDFYTDILSNNHAMHYNNLLSNHADMNSSFISHSWSQQQHQQWAPNVTRELSIPINSMSSMSLHDRMF